MSYSPRTGLVYIPVTDLANSYQASKGALGADVIAIPIDPHDKEALKNHGSLVA